MINIIFSIIYIILDMILLIVIPNDFSLINPCFMPCIAYCGMLLIIKNDKLFDVIIKSFIFGLVIDFINGDHMLLCALIYTFSAIIYYLWSKHLSESIFELTLILLVMVFVKEVFLYSYYIFSNAFVFSFSKFLESRLFITLVGNILPIVILIFIDNIRKDFENYHDRIKRNNESLFGSQFK